MTTLAITADLLARTLIAVVLISAAAAKLLNISFTIESFRKLNIINAQYLSTFVILVSATELCLGLSLLFPPVVIVTSASSFLLFLTFAIVLNVKMRVDDAASCGCFGKDRQEKIGVKSVLRACVLAGASLLILLSHVFSNVALAQTAFALGGLALAIAGVVLLPRKNQDEHSSGIANEGREISSTYTSWYNRRTILQLLGAVGLSIFLPLPRSAGAAGCCKCEYQRHYDPTCCSGSALGVHHYWRRCYNTCTGQRGSWRKIQPDSCQCECRMCQDQTWVQDECCFQWECNCCGPCPC